MAIKVSINKGLSDDLNAAFPDITPVPRPKVEEIITQDIHPWWVAGFTEGEGCFNVVVTKSPHTKSGFLVSLCFQITQHFRDIVLMQNLINFWGCGRVSKRSNTEAVDFLTTKFSDLTDKIIPFFERIPLQGLKYKNFADFSKIAEIIKVKEHLTPEGLEKIIQLKAGMNSRRI